MGNPGGLTQKMVWFKLWRKQANGLGKKNDDDQDHDEQQIIIINNNSNNDNNRLFWWEKVSPLCKQGVI
jgi:hypothetical protein